VGRPRKPDKKLPISFRASPELASRLEQFALALGTTTSDAIERALAAYFESPLADEAIIAQESRRTAAASSLRARAAATTAARSVDREALRLLREHLLGATYLKMVSDTELTATDARLLVRQARADLDEHLPALTTHPEILDGLLGRRR
jgi:predicted transcriptional regulator